MPTCRECNKVFKSYAKVNGQPRNICNRRFCLECSPWQSKRNAQSLDTKNQKDAKNTNKTLRTCQACNRKYIYSYQAGHGLTKCNSCKVNARRKILKQRAVQLKGGCCVRCGYNRCIESLIFHHNKGIKNFSIAAAAANRPWREIEKELELCILICANCHGEEHERMRGDVA